MNTEIILKDMRTIEDIFRFEQMVADIKNLKCVVGDDASNPQLSRVILSSIKNIKHEIEESGISHTNYRMHSVLMDIDNIEKEELSFLKEKGYNIW